MNDPYRILGLNQGASDDEVKKAYRKLAKKYHPDANPGDKTAEQRMKEINAAYDAIINKKTYGSQNAGGSYYNGGTNYGNSYGGYDPFGFGYYRQQQQRQNTGQGNSYYEAAKNYINFGRYAEAMNVLDGISNRNAEWYYLAAYASYGLGNRIRAKEYAEKACSMEPNNFEYRSLLNRINGNQSAYNSYTARQGYSRPGLRVNKFCLAYCIAQLICGLFCRPNYYRGYFC